jgi:integrase
VKKGRTRSEVWTAYADWVAVTGKKLAPRPDNATASMKPLDARHVLPLHAVCYLHPQLSGDPGVRGDPHGGGGPGRVHVPLLRHAYRTRLSEAGVSDDLAKRLGGWTEDSTAARYDHAERVEELRAAIEKAG